jgi:hypothetical protein
MKRFFAFVLLAFGFASASHAAYVPTTWTDADTFGNGELVSVFNPYTYTHDLTEQGFRPQNDLIQSYQLAITWADDDNNFWRDGFEIPFVDLSANFSADHYGFSILGVLNELGTLTVTIHSLLGDFNLLGSTLTAHGYSNVPEPGALGLLGIGLVGIALSSRRRKQAA